MLALSRWLLGGALSLALNAGAAEPVPAITVITPLAPPATAITELKESARLALTLNSSRDVQARFATQVLKTKDWYPHVAITHRLATNHFNRVTFNQHGGGFDAIRFKAPESTVSGYELAWMFGYPAGRKFKWYILPVEGEMMGFNDFDKELDAYFDLVAPWKGLKPRYRGFSQSLIHGQIKPGREYIIWFTMLDEGPADFYLAINLLPPGTRLSTIGERMNALGFEAP